jgi:hypothetical protein
MTILRYKTNFKNIHLLNSEQINGLDSQVLMRAICTTES